MKKTHWPARLAAGCLVTLTLVGVAFAAGQQGSQSDPLVTLSYLTQKATFYPRWTASSRPGRRS